MRKLGFSNPGVARSKPYQFLSQTLGNKSTCHKYTRMSFKKYVHHHAYKETPLRYGIKRRLRFVALRRQRCLKRSLIIKGRNQQSIIQRSLYALRIYWWFW